MAGKVGDRLFIDTVMKQRTDKKMAHGVQMIILWESVLVKKPAQMLGERVRVDQLALFIGEQIVAHLEAAHLGIFLFPAAVGHENRCNILIDGDRAAAPVFG